MSKTLQELCSHIQSKASQAVELRGDSSVSIERMNTLANATSGDLSFVTNENYLEQVAQTRASALLVDQKFEASIPENIPHIVMNNAYLGVAFLTQYLYPQSHPSFGIHPSATIEEGAQLGENVQVGPHVFVGKGSVIGDDVVLYPNVVLGENVSIGHSSVLYPNVSVYRECRIGERCIIHSGTVIGSDGFGFATDPQKMQHHKVNQLGAVVIESDVEIGSNCSIDRGAQEDTYIGKGARLDNLIQVAHGVKVGKGSVLVSQCGISGSTELGMGVVVGGQVGITGHLHIDNGVHIGAQTGVAQSLKNPNFPKPMEYWGFPKAMPLDQAKKTFMRLLRFPKYIEKIKNLEDQLRELQKNLQELHSPREEEKK